MQIGFFLSRPNQLRIHGPVIREAIRRGHECRLLVPLDALHGHNMPGATPCPVEPLITPAQVAAVDAFVGVAMLPHPMLPAARVAAPRTLFCALPYLQEELLRVLTDGMDALQMWDLVGTGSQEGLEFLIGQLRLATGEDWLRKRVVPVGHTVLDGLEGMDSETCRLKHGLPAGQPIICFGTAARSHLLGKWRVGAYLARPAILANLMGMTAYIQILRAVRTYADRHGAFVLAKTRDKHRDPRYVRRYVDRIISDESHWPPTTLEVLMASHLYIGIASAMSIEAAACGLPQYTFLPYDLRRAEHPLYLPFRQRFYLQAGGLWNSVALQSRRLDRDNFSQILREAPWPTGPTQLGALYRITGQLGASEWFLHVLEQRRLDAQNR